MQVISTALFSCRYIISMSINIVEAKNTGYALTYRHTVEKTELPHSENTPRDIFEIDKSHIFARYFFYSVSLYIELWYLNLTIVIGELL